MRSAHPLPWPAAGLLLTIAGLLVPLLCDGATLGDPSALALAVRAGLDDGLGLVVVLATGAGGGATVVGGGAAVVGGGGGGAGTDEMWEA
jgi:hypothetical protein